MQPLPKTPLPEFPEAPEWVNEATALEELLRVSAQQSQMFCWPAGTHVVALRGSVQLTETPEWQGETLLRPRIVLQQHASHTLRRNGWVLLLAREDAVLRVVRPVPVPAVRPSGARAFWQNVQTWLGLRSHTLAD